MTFTVEAIYEGGVLRPSCPLPIGERERVEVIVHAPKATLPPPAERQEALRRLLSQELPVADWEQMEQEIVRGAVE